MSADRRIDDALGSASGRNLSAGHVPSDGSENRAFSQAAEVQWLDAATPLLGAYAEACCHLRDWDDFALWDVAAEFRRVVEWLRDHEAPSSRLDELRRAALRAAEASGRLALAKFARRPTRELETARSVARKANQRFARTAEAFEAEAA